uniref:Phosphatidylinositol N-acetylglucosaminyltransferase gpi3 subunit n=1 Tax=Lygus hesperus TaxID=30085 RepID=A0A0A9YUF0_LYGHE
MRLHTVYTDHSLLSINSSISIHLNKALQYTLTAVDHVITVSHILRENIVLRTNIDPQKVSTIPNAIDARKFRPDPSSAPDISKQLNIVILSRLVFRKGIDLIIDIIPPICARYPHVHFIIGGSGPKESRIREIIEEYKLHDRIE